MKIIAISDTHNYHGLLQLPTGDLLLHAGDVSGRGTEQEVRNFLEWFARQDFTHKIFIAGNHDFFFERMPASLIQSIIPDNIIYLNDSGAEIEGINIWGSPIQPWFFDWAFQRQRGAEISQHWQMIPEDTDILITHGPAYGILDKTIRNESVGCEDLLNRIKKVKPKYFISGHIHEAYGVEQHGATTFVNASVLDVQYKLVNRPIVLAI